MHSPIKYIEKGLAVAANGAWSVDEAVEALGRLTAFDLEYAEQPCASV